jgi:hypothetical protein
MNRVSNTTNEINDDCIIHEIFTKDGNRVQKRQDRLSA